MLCAVAYAQSYEVKVEISEPDFLGECFYLNNNETVSIDKEYCKLKRAKFFSWSRIGIGTAPKKIEIKKKNAHTRIPAGDITLIVRAADNKKDPFTIVKVLKLKEEKKKRSTPITETDILGGLSSETDQEFVKYTAKKFGKSSYMVTFKNLEPGEYGVVVANPKAKDDESVVINCFGVDESAYNH